MPDIKNDRPPRTAGDVAAYLNAVLVNGPLYVSVPGEACGAITHAAFVAQTRLYRQASVLTALELAQAKRVEFGAVITAFEAYVFLAPVAEFAHGASDTTFRVLAAMRELARLLGPGGVGTASSWAQQWFASLHVHVTDPVELTRHAESWEQFWQRANANLDAVSLLPASPARSA